MTDNRLLDRLPDNRLGWALARLSCRCGWHSLFCRGRADHVRADGTVIQ